MDCQDPIATLLAFYANGTLPEEERRRVEAHLDGCIDCRALLGLAQLAHEEMSASALDPVGHVQAQLLVEFVENPVALGEETRAWVSSHLEGCEVCASVVPVLRGLPAGARSEALDIGRPSSAAPASARLWEFLKATVLRPIPAMAYLAVAVVGVVWILRGGGPGLVEQDPAVLLPPAIPVHGEIAMRGEEVASPPLRLDASPGVPVRLALHTDLDPEETAPGAPKLHLLLRHGTDVLWSAVVDPGTIPPDGVLEMTLRPDRLPRNVPLELALVHDPVGERPPLFLKMILLSEPGESRNPDRP